jgi:hypothetical protein
MALWIGVNVANVGEGPLSGSEDLPITAGQNAHAVIRSSVNSEDTNQHLGLKGSEPCQPGGFTGHQLSRRDRPVRHSRRPWRGPTTPADLVEGGSFVILTVHVDRQVCPSNKVAPEAPGNGTSGRRDVRVLRRDLGTPWRRGRGHSGSPDHNPPDPRSARSVGLSRVWTHAGVSTGRVRQDKAV